MTTKQLTAARRASRVGAAGAAAAVAFVLAGCGGGSSNSSSAPPATTTGSAAPTASATSSAGAQGTMVNVDEVDFKINLSVQTFKPGMYTFVVKNTGHTSHALKIDGPGLEDRKTDTVSPGGSTMLTVTLQKGSYELYCPVDGHKDLGMDMHITVA